MHTPTTTWTFQPQDDLAFALELKTRECERLVDLLGDKDRLFNLHNKTTSDAIDECVRLERIIVDMSSQHNALCVSHERLRAEFIASTARYERELATQKAAMKRIAENNDLNYITIEHLRRSLKSEIAASKASRRPPEEPRATKPVGADTSYAAVSQRSWRK